MLYRLLALLATAVLATGCAHNASPGTPNDPWEPTNRELYEFNEALDRRVLKPLADGYVWITPRFFRGRVTDFFNNVSYPKVIVNSFLQGKPVEGLQDSGRFLVNSTLGIGGLFDVATPLGLPVHDEDFGQTFAVWGFKSGPYLMVPALGPYTVRHTIDIPLRTVTSPLTYLLSASYSLPLTALYVVNLRAELGPALQLRDEAALDPYVFVRSSYLQHRENLIHDGNPPMDYYDDELFDEWPEE